MSRHRSTRIAALASVGTPAFVPPKACRPRTVLTRFALAALLAMVWSGPAAAQAPLQFARTDYPVGANPFGVAIGDLNNDGHPDVVVTNQGSTTITRWLGDGTGALSGRQDFTVGSGPFALAAGDLDGNGTLDLAVACINVRSISVLLGNGAGGFAPSVAYTTDVTPLSIAVTELDGDGIPDIVTANHSGHSISILLGTGGGAFAAPVNLPIGAFPYALAVGDLNHDAKPDVAAVNFYDNTVSVRLGNGGSSFGPATSFPTGINPSSIAIGDLGGDGIPDLVVANSGSNTISVLRGDGSGSFAARVDYATGTTPVTVAIGDINADGKPDLAVTNKVSKSVSVFLANLTGSFDPRLDFPAGDNAWGVAIRDLDGDGSPDLAVTNANDATVSILIQAPGDQRLPSSTQLISDLNPGDVGQPVTFTATVSPGAATGTVQFLDGTQLLGTAPLNAGYATLPVTSLLRGSHSITAIYGGDLSYRPSLSTVLVQAMNGLPTATSISSSSNPSVLTQSVRFTAVVTAAPPGSGTPTGSVQFKLDGASFGAPVALAAGQATSATTSTLAIGNHTVEAGYAGDRTFEPSTSPTLVQVVETSSLVIVGIRDVPHDQGGRVSLTWRSTLDQPGLKVVTGYRVWRRAPDPTAGPGARAGAAEPGAQPASAPEDHARDVPGGERTQEDFWEAIATLPAGQLVSYAYTAPTLQDSMAGSNPYTAFFVTALTADPFVYFQSAPDSGYSVDDLSPPTPMPFAAVYGLSSTALHWGASPAPDLREFRLYSGPSPDFVPGPSQLVIATRDTGYVDAVHTFYYYKLAAVDIHGNTSRFAAVSPNGPVAVLASLASIEAGPDRIRLTWYAAGGPGLTATVYRRTALSDWTALATLEADGRGYLRYEDAAVRAGERYGYRLGIVDGEGEVFVGEAWAVAERQVFALEGIRPNPAAGSALTVFFSLPNAEPARLELLDVSGRRMVARDVGALGPGRHTLDLAAGMRIPPGMYLVRLSQRGNTRTVRAAVLN